ncbi:MAG TPA: putative manganese-dependent inorganic diphosphatase [Methanospirillum sp.]|nr:putative manganese-dependent inorganic diphosphatase [Methanospirillum sp.]
MQTIYVLGHRQPDTDSIASATAYADLLSRTRDGNFIAGRCGEINAETRFVLSEAGLADPLLIESVEPVVGDIPFLYAQQAPHDMASIDVASLMDEHDVRNIPIVDEQGILLGLVSEHGLARAYVSPHASLPLRVGPISTATLSRILIADVVHQAHEFLDGQVSIVIDALHVSLSQLGSEDVAIVGDNEPAQLALVFAGIGALIIAEGAPVGERVREAARSRSVTLIRTDLDAFSVGRMIHLSHPASAIMARDVEIVHMEDSLTAATRVVTNSPYRTACVVDEEGRLLGMISRNTFLEEIHKSVILVDHNEFAQAVEGIETAEVLEIIDHHRLGTISTLRPIQFRNEPVGSTSTIITFRYQEEGVVPSKEIATLLLAGILSDTLVLKMSTTTARDREAVEYLAPLAEKDPQIFGSTLIQKGMDLDGIPIDDLLSSDVKEYNLYDRKVVIAQVMMASDAYSHAHESAIQDALTRLRQKTGADLYITLFTDVIGQVSYLFACGDSGLLNRLSYAEQPVVLPQVMSRKKDFFPVFGQKLRAALM